MKYLHFWFPTGATLKIPMKMLNFLRIRAGDLLTLDKEGYMIFVRPKSRQKPKRSMKPYIGRSLYLGKVKVV